MNKDAQGRWKVGMSNIKLKMRGRFSLGFVCLGGCAPFTFCSFRTFLSQPHYQTERKHSDDDPITNIYAQHPSTLQPFLPRITIVNKPWNAEDEFTDTTEGREPA